MSSYPSWKPGMSITAARLAAGLPVYVANSVLQTNATTTLANVTGLSFVAAANALYKIELLVSYDAPTATDIKIAWTGPAGSSMDRHILANDLGTTTNIATSVINIRRAIGTAQAAGAPNGTSNAFTVWREDSILTTVTGGTTQLQFAANAAGTATLQAASYMIVQQIG